MNKFQSIFANRCPRCRAGSLFTKPFDLRNPMKMHTRCTECGQKFEPEVGFYYGAMFVSYIIVGSFSLIFALTLIFLFGLSVNLTFGLLILILALGFVWNLRFSRSLWIHVNVKYDPFLPVKQTREKELT